MIVFVFACARSIRGYRNRRVLIRRKLCTFTIFFLTSPTPTISMIEVFFCFFLLFSLSSVYTWLHTPILLYMFPHFCVFVRVEHVYIICRLNWHIDRKKSYSNWNGAFHTHKCTEQHAHKPDVTIEILTTENTQTAVAIVCYSLTNQIKYIIKWNFVFIFALKQSIRFQFTCDNMSFQHLDIKCITPAV